MVHRFGRFERKEGGFVPGKELFWAEIVSCRRLELKLQEIGVEVAGMGFVSFAGRVLFSSIFILSAWQKINEFGHDGGTAVKHLEPKYSFFKNQVTSILGLQVPEIETKHLLMAAIGLEGIGGILFTFGSTLGAYFLLIFLAVVTPVMHDFYNYDMARPEYVREFIEFLKNLSLFGALLFFLGMKNSSAKNSKKKTSKAKTN